MYGAHYTKLKGKGMKRNIIGSMLLILMIALGAFIYFQNGRDSKIVTSYKNSHGNTSSVILNVNANKLFLTDQNAYDILYKTCINYAGAARCDQITVYLFANRYSFLHDKIHCIGVYKSRDLINYNTKDNPEEFWLELLPVP